MALAVARHYCSATALRHALGISFNYSRGTRSTIGSLFSGSCLRGSYTDAILYGRYFSNESECSDSMKSGGKQNKKKSKKKGPTPQEAAAKKAAKKAAKEARREERKRKKELLVEKKHARAIRQQEKQAMLRKLHEDAKALRLRYECAAKRLEVHERVIEYFAAANKVLIAIDVEISNSLLDVPEVTAVGITAWDLRDGTARDTKFTMIRYLRVEPDWIGRQAADPNEAPFDFGDTETVWIEDCKPVLQELFQEYYERAVFVGHGVKKRLEGLEKLETRAYGQLPLIETMDVWKQHAGEGAETELDVVMAGLEVPVTNLENSGNKAYYTMKILQHMYGMTREKGAGRKEEVGGNGVEDGGDIVQRFREALAGLWKRKIAKESNLIL
ncbi:uncharacterized protein V1518DRAFT_418882 [Limtongia smithiae]|uniref:uncharacterized protein n=1 Tax=Limtongia smithiae TaxID=1125753 RepID=UPI0034CEE63A